MNETLDGLHEDLNLIKKKPYVEVGDIGKLEPEQFREVGRRSWIDFLKRNYSHVIKLFFAQYKSEIECKKCGKISNTFDPYHIVSLPIPKLITESITFFHITPNQNTKAIRYTVELKYEKGRMDEGSLPTAGTVLREFGKSMNIDPDNLVLTFLGFSVIGEIIPNNRLTPDITTKMNDHTYKPKLFLLQLTPIERAKFTNPNLQIFIALGVLGRSNPAFNKVTFMLKGETLADLYFEYYKKLAHYYKYLYEDKRELDVVETNVDYITGFKEHFLNLAQDKRAFQLAYRENAIPLSNEILISEFFKEELAKNPKQIELVLEFSEDAYDDIFVGGMKDCSTNPTDIEVNMVGSENSKIDIKFLIEKFSEREEMIDENNLVYCSKCKEHTPSYKRLQIFTAPRILVLHMKKLKELTHVRNQSLREKPYLDIGFPLENFDMTDFVVSRQPVSSYNIRTSEFVASENEEVNKRMDLDYHFPEGSRLVYDCYAVINHYGSSYFGHYNSYIKTDAEQWHCFDDDSVRKVDSPNDVITEAAYVLFYKLREVKTQQ